MGKKAMCPKTRPNKIQKEKRIMKLFKLTRKDGKIFLYDNYKEAVVCAKDKKEASLIHPSGKLVGNWLHDWVNVKDVKVEYLGEAKSRLKKGVVCASFNAG
jgi:hypothetical protein